MNKQFKRYLQINLVLLDLVMLNVCMILPRLILHERISDNAFNAYATFWIFCNLMWLVFSFLAGSYVEKIILQFEAFTKRTTQVYILWVIFILIYLFFSREILISRIFIISLIILFGLGLLIDRFIYLGIKKYFKSKEYLVNKVIILGYNETALKLATYFEQEAINTSLIGFVEDEANVAELTHYPILGPVKDLIEIAKANDVQEIYSTISPEQNRAIYEMIYQAENDVIRFKVVPNLSQFFSKPVVVDYLRDLPILSMRNEPLEDVGNRLKKRILDFSVSLIICIVILSWLIPLIGLLIFIESRGPIFFIQKRTGKNNKTFNCLKFRSMRMNQDADVKQATKGDKRITTIGRFLRKTSLDEFPQFINVLRGEMSLVGPRPHMEKHTSDYSQIVDQYMIRHFLKPGITGWAQVNGFRGEITDPKQIKMRVQNDLWYLENWNIWLDIRILFLTVYTIIRGDKHAY